MEKTNFLQTSDTQAIRYVVHTMCEDPGIGLIHGASGAGKTYSTTIAIQGLKRRTVFLPIVPPISPKGLMVSVARQLKLKTSGTCEQLTERIFSHLDQEPCLLIIDEGEHLSVKALEWLRRLNDLTAAAILLIGTEQLYHKIGSEPLEQLKNRIDLCWPMQALESVDTERYCKKHGLSDHDTVHKLTKGNFRKLARLLKRAGQFAKDQGKPLSEIKIKDVAKFLPAFN